MVCIQCVYYFTKLNYKVTITGFRYFFRISRNQDKILPRYPDDSHIHFAKIFSLEKQSYSSTRGLMYSCLKSFSELISNYFFFSKIIGSQ